ncbi:hypothetical protein PVAP13_6KG298400 [Panicum virgatum]|uniref:Uncharacterized protein n=1 Tax=Panicum virgatum TaxID=38727 RepID=A0A8T0RIA6_PANVG|nr:hypothetical protein PVAP13_6KG298400 [Panicum virgatum]
MRLGRKKLTIFSFCFGTVGGPNSFPATAVFLYNFVSLTHEKTRDFGGQRTARHLHTGLQAGRANGDRTLAAVGDVRRLAPLLPEQPETRHRRFTAAAGTKASPARRQPPRPARRPPPPRARSPRPRPRPRHAPPAGAHHRRGRLLARRGEGGVRQARPAPRRARRPGRRPRHGVLRAVHDLAAELRPAVEGAARHRGRARLLPAKPRGGARRPRAQGAEPGGLRPRPRRAGGGRRPGRVRRRAQPHVKRFLLHRRRRRGRRVGPGATAARGGHRRGDREAQRLGPSPFPPAARPARMAPLDRPALRGDLSCSGWHNRPPAGRGLLVRGHARRFPRRAPRAPVRRQGRS